MKDEKSPIEFAREGYTMRLYCTANVTPFATATTADLRAAGFVPVAELEEAEQELTYKIRELWRLTRERDEVVALLALRSPKPSAREGGKEDSDSPAERQPYKRGINSTIISAERADSGTQSELGEVPVTNAVAPGVEETGLLRDTEAVELLREILSQYALKPHVMTTRERDWFDRDNAARDLEKGIAILRSRQSAKDPRAAWEGKLERVAHEVACYQAGWTAAMVRCGYCKDCSHLATEHADGFCTKCECGGYIVDPAPSPATPLETDSGWEGPSIFSDESKEAAWQSALALLHSTGADVPELLRKAAENVERYGHGGHEFPDTFPADDPAPAPNVERAGEAAEYVTNRSGRWRMHGPGEPGIATLVEPAPQPPATEQARPLAALLEEARLEAMPRLVHDIAGSMASFIAAIDSNSSHVAAYIEQRLQPLISMARVDIRCQAGLRRIADDGRSLTGEQASEPNTSTAEAEYDPLELAHERIIAIAPDEPGSSEALRDAAGLLCDAIREHATPPSRSGFVTKADLLKALDAAIAASRNEIHPNLVAQAAFEAMREALK